MGEMVSFYAGRYMDQMCKGVYASIGKKMVAAYPDVERDLGGTLHGWSALTRELSAKLRYHRQVTMQACKQKVLMTCNITTTAMSDINCAFPTQRHEAKKRALDEDTVKEDDKAAVALSVGAPVFSSPRGPKKIRKIASAIKPELRVACDKDTYLLHSREVQKEMKKAEPNNEQMKILLKVMGRFIF